MFEREHHIRIATVLQSLNADLLSQNQCWFGGGTAIVLAYSEYRESVNIDFLVSNSDGYRSLRNLLTSKGINSIVRPGMELNATRDIRADQYGLRTMLCAGNTEIKFEIVLEARIDLENPPLANRICGVQTLTRLDMATSKLLANSDRWSDDAVPSRDLIDLAMLNLTKEALVEATMKATTAYGEAITRDLDNAIKALGQRRGRLDECMSALKIDQISTALLWSRIRALRS